MTIMMLMSKKYFNLSFLLAVQIKNLTHLCENLEFLDFLQSDYCKKILHSNDLKIHIETGNIYYKDDDTNESIFEFMKNQQDSSKGLINIDLKYEGSYNHYFQWILNGFDLYEKTKFELLSFKNTKYLL